MELEKKRDLILEKYMEEFDLGMEYLKDQIRHHLYEGITGWLLNPIASWLYKIFVAPSIRDQALDNFNALFECAQEFNGDPVCMESAMNIIDSKFEDLIENDPSYQRFDKKHEKAEEMKELIKEGFAQQLLLTKKLMDSPGETYEEIIRNAFKDRENFKVFTEEQLENTYRGLELLVSEKKLLKVPGIIRNSTKRMLRKGYDYTVERAWQQLDEIFPE
ncbi:MAG: hypothetical protein ACTSO9_11775 [Candidatus Helarchaeota archaeon]